MNRRPLGTIKEPLVVVAHLAGLSESLVEDSEEGLGRAVYERLQVQKCIQVVVFLDKLRL